jgi:hypothetical protein
VDFRVGANGESGRKVKIGDDFRNEMPDRKEVMTALQESLLFSLHSAEGNSGLEFRDPEKRTTGEGNDITSPRFSADWVIGGSHDQKEQQNCCCSNNNQWKGQTWE